MFTVSPFTSFLLNQGILFISCSSLERVFGVVIVVGLLVLSLTLVSFVKGVTTVGGTVTFSTGAGVIVRVVVLSDGATVGIAWAPYFSKSESGKTCL